jgi:hypothetical protein
MGAAGRDHARERFTIRHTARRVEAIYDDLLTRADASGGSLPDRRHAVD